jgi:KDO2-lipid IV(A) lauroyltransferase
LAQGVNNYRVLGLARFVSRHLPRSGAYWLGRRIAGVFHALDRRGRRAVIANCRQILVFKGAADPDAAATRMAREVFRKFGQYLADFFRYERLTREDFAGLIQLEGLAHLEAAFAARRGVILITAHLGNWELGGAVISALGYPLTAVAFPERVGKTNDLFQQQRRRRGMRVLTFGAAARGSLAALQRGEIVAMLADRDFTQHRDAIPFFGKPARLPTAPVRISRHTGAPILPGFILRRPDNCFHVRFHPPLWPDRDTDGSAARAAIRDALQEEIGRDPTQWFVFEDFWAKGVPHAAPPSV